MKIKALRVKNNYNGNDVIVNISEAGDYVQISEVIETGYGEKTEQIITVSLKDFDKIVKLFNM